MTHGGFLHYFTEDWEESSKYQGAHLPLHSPFQRSPIPPNHVTRTDNLTGINVEAGTGWLNTEYRTYTFSEEEHKDDLEGYELDGDNATLVETIESRERRDKAGPMADRDQQRLLYKLGTQGWDDQGLQLSTAERESAKITEGKEVGRSKA